MATGKKEVKYLGKDFVSLRDNLVNFAKIYYPNTYRDFNESSPGMMFIELASYVGDVLSFYMDKQFKEGLLYYAEERENVLNLAYTLGYTPRVTSPATTTLDVFQIVPAIGTGASNAPDFRYATRVRANAVVKSKTNSNVGFRTLEDVDFRFSSSVDTTDVSVYQINSGTNEVEYYLLKKSVGASAGILTQTSFTIGEPQKFLKILLPDDDIVEINNITDSDGYTWYHVPYLAQDTIATSVLNDGSVDSTLTVYNTTTPYLLKLKKVPRRFTSRVRSDNKIELQFGSGISDSPDEEIVPNPSTLGSPLADGTYTFNQNIDPTNFLFTKTYGQIPHNTTLTVSYYRGGGLQSNVGANDITATDNVVIDLTATGLDSTVVQQIKNSVAFTNPLPAVGGADEESVEEIRLNALANFASQNRAVTVDDYMVRAMSMPQRFGSVSKVFVVKDDQLTTYSALNETKSDYRIANPFAINLYCLGYDSNKKLTTLNPAVKQNLKNYMSQYRMLTDAINIMDGFVVNIGVKFQIMTLPKYNKNEVLLNATNAVRSYFNIDKWTFNKPIVLHDISMELMKVEGVQTVIGLPEVYNVFDTSQGYSGNIYDINAAMDLQKGIIYPSLDPCVFEVKFPEKDILGKVVTY